MIVLNNWSEASDADILAALAADPLWGELRAVKIGRVVHLPNYSNPIASSIAAATKTLDLIVPAIFPKTFDGPLTDAQVRAALDR